MPVGTMLFRTHRQDVWCVVLTHSTSGESDRSLAIADRYKEAIHVTSDVAVSLRVVMSSDMKSHRISPK